MNKEYIIMKVEKLIAMFVIAMGTYNDAQFEYSPKLPSCFAENLYIKPLEYDADFLRLTVNNVGGVECWFIDKNQMKFAMSLRDVMRYVPLLYTSIVTHVFDMIENVKEC